MKYEFNWETDSFSYIQFIWKIILKILIPMFHLLYINIEIVWKTTGILKYININSTEYREIRVEGIDVNETSLDIYE